MIQCRKGIRDPLSDGVQCFVVCVFRSRPEKAFQAVSLSPRNDVDVKMGNALADPVVNGHKAALRVHALLDSLREQLRILK